MSQPVRPARKRADRGLETVRVPMQFLLLEATDDSANTGIRKALMRRECRYIDADQAPGRRLRCKFKTCTQIVYFADPPAPSEC